MCRLVGEERCTKLVINGKPFRLFDTFPSRLDETRDPTKVTLYRGLHSVIDPNLSTPGCWWTFSPRIAAKYADNGTLLYLHGLGSVLSGHILAAEIPLDFEDIRTRRDSFNALRKLRSVIPDEELELHEIYIPFRQADVLKDVRIESTRSYLVNDVSSANDFD